MIADDVDAIRAALSARVAVDGVRVVSMPDGVLVVCVRYAGAATEYGRFYRTTPTAAQVAADFEHRPS